MRIRVITFVIVLACMSVLVFPRGAQAQSDEPQFAFLPVPTDDPTVTEKGYFTYRMASGSQSNGQVSLQNTGDQPFTVNLAPVDASTAQNGGSTFADVSATPVAVATWIHLEQTSVIVAPNTRLAVGFTVSVPKSVAPGQHLAGIAAYIAGTPADAAQNETQDPRGPVIKLHRRYVIAVEADVQGVWTPKLRIDGVKLFTPLSGASLGVQLRNDGGTFLKPSGTLVLTNTNGKRLLSQPITMDTFVAGTEVSYPIKWRGQVVPGSYPVAVEMTYGEGQKASYHGTIDISEEAAAIASPPEDIQPPDQSYQSPSLARSSVNMLRPLLIGISLTIALALVSVYFYQRKRRKPVRISA